MSIERLEKVVKGVKIYKQDKILSPGTYPCHYSPKAKVLLIEDNGDVQIEKVKNLASRFNSQGCSLGILATEEHGNKYDGFKVKIIGPEKDLTICATNLFSALREFDKEGVDIIIAEGVEEKGLGLAIVDRLKKSQEGKMRNV